MVVEKFERAIADFFGSPFAVAVDSCTHGIELCLRYLQVNEIVCPHRTYLSVPMLASKLGIKLTWVNSDWEGAYLVVDNHAKYDVADAAVLWRRGSYRENTFMCLSFQYQKHLSLGRGGMILCQTHQQYIDLKKMSYDGRLPNIPWREQDIDTMGYHYYMTPETAQLGLDKLPEAIKTPPRIWTVEDWPDLTKMKIWQKKH